MAVDGRWGVSAQMAGFAFLTASPVLVFTKRLGVAVGSSWGLYGLWLVGYWALVGQAARWLDGYLPEDAFASLDAAVMMGLLLLVGLVGTVVLVGIPVLLAIAIAAVPGLALEGLKTACAERIGGSDTRATRTPAAEQGKPQSASSPGSKPHSPGDVSETTRPEASEDEATQPLSQSDAQAPHWFTGLFVVIVVGSVVFPVWDMVVHHSVSSALATFAIWVLLSVGILGLATGVASHRRRK